MHWNHIVYRFPDSMPTECKSPDLCGNWEICTLANTTGNSDIDITKTPFEKYYQMRNHKDTRSIYTYIIYRS